MKKEIGIATTLSLTSSIASAGTAECLVGGGATIVIDYLIGQVANDNLGHWSIGLLATILTMTWILGWKTTRGAASRLYGFAILGFAIATIVSFLSLGWECYLALPWYFIILAPILIFASFMAIMKWIWSKLKSLPSKAVDLVKGSAEKERTSVFFAGVGAPCRG